MRMRKTRDDFQVLAEIHPQGIGWNEMLALMMDIFLDVRDETQRELNELEFNAESLQKWRTIANTMLSIPMDHEADALSERSRQRLDSYRKQLADYVKESDSVQKELQAASEEERRLQAQLEEHEKTCEKLKARKRSAAELRDQIESLKQEIDSIKHVSVGDLEKIKSRLTDEIEEKNRLLEDYRQASARLQNLTDECERLQSDYDSIQAKLETVKDKKINYETGIIRKTGELEDTEKICQELQTSVEDLDEKISSVKISVKSKNDEIVNKKIELQEKLKEQSSAQLALDNTLEQIKTAKAERDELAARHQQMESEFDGITAQIANLKSESPDLRKRIEEQKAQLEDVRNQQDGEIQMLSRQIDDLNESIGETNARLSELSVEKSAAEERLSQRDTEKEKISAEVDRLQAQIGKLEQSCIELNGKKDELLNRRNLYANDIAEFKKFFDSDQCRQIQQEIQRYSMIIDEYQAAVTELFQTKGIVFADKLADLNEPYQRKKDLLREELNEIRDSFAQLDTDYLTIIEALEERVSL